MRFLIISILIILSSCASEKKENSEDKLLHYLETINVLKEKKTQLIFLFHNNSCSFCVNELVESLKKTENSKKKISIVFFDSEIISQIDKEKLFDLKKNYPFFLMDSKKVEFDNKETHAENYLITKNSESKKMIKLESDYQYYNTLIEKYGN